MGIAVPPVEAYGYARPRRERARDLAPAARQAPEPAKRTGGVIFLVNSVIDPLQEPLVFAEVVVQLAKNRAVEERLPVLANDELVPPLRLDLPTSDRVD